MSDASLGDAQPRRAVLATEGPVLQFISTNTFASLIPSEYIVGIAQLLNIPPALATRAQSTIAQATRSRIAYICDASVRGLPTVRHGSNRTRIGVKGILQDLTRYPFLPFTPTVYPDSLSLWTSQTPLGFSQTIALVCGMPVPVPTLKAVLRRTRPRHWLPAMRKLFCVVYASISDLWFGNGMRAPASTPKQFFLLLTPSFPSLNTQLE